MLGECRTEDDGEVGERGKAASYGVLHGADSLRALVGHKVPLVDAHHQALLVLLYEREDVSILTFDASSGINHEHAHVGVFDSTNASNHRVILDILVHLGFFAYAGSVDEVKVESELVEACVDAVASGSGNVGYDVTLFADEGVDNRRFSGIRASNNGKARYVLGLLFLSGVRHQAQHLVEQIARSRAVDCRHRHRVAQSQRIEFGSGIHALVVVGFVCDQNHRLLAAAQDVSHVVVEVGHAVFDVHHKENHIGFFDGKRNLLIDFFFEYVFAIHHPTAGVDD